MKTQEKIQKIYEVIGPNKYLKEYVGGIAGYNYNDEFIFIGDILEHIYSTPVRTEEERELKVINLCDLRFENGLHQPLPLDAGEERKEVIDYIYSLIK